MFRGVTSVNLDNKGRMAIPTRYREALARQCEGQLVLTVDSRENCLLLYPLPNWEEIERKLVKLPSLNAHAQRLKRLLIGHAADVEMDGSGRILVSPPLREFAGLLKASVLIGQGNKFELWAEDTWNTRRSEWLGSENIDQENLPPELESLSL